MSIRATSAGGAQVEFSSCHDDEFPPSNCISPDTSEFWMLTGMFPHEIVIRLPASATVRQVQISSMNREKSCGRRRGARSPAKLGPRVRATTAPLPVSCDLSRSWFGQGLQGVGTGAGFLE